MVARGQVRAAESWKQKPRRELVTAAGGAPAGSGRGTPRTSNCQGSPLPWVHPEASSSWSIDARGAHWEVRPKEKERDARDNSTESPEEGGEHAGGHQGSWKSSEHGPALFSPSQESREA